MYKIIDQMRSVRKVYTETLVRRGDMSIERGRSRRSTSSTTDSRACSTRCAPCRCRHSRESRSPRFPLDLPAPADRRRPSDRCSRSRASTDVGAPRASPSTRSSSVNSSSAAPCSNRGEVDWALGEALAFGSLALEGGSNVRLMGQDSRRGTFSHRHAALIDYENGAQYVPLANLDSTGFFTVRDSFLSEYAALGFEYGYSVEATEHARGVGGAVRRLRQRRRDHHRQLPGRRRGQVGTAREPGDALAPRLRGSGSRTLERSHRAVLVAVRAQQHPRRPAHDRRPSTSTCLRSQVLREHITPLIVFTPKSMLRAVQTRSPLAAFEHGSFQTVLDDHGADVGVGDPRGARDGQDGPRGAGATRRDSVLVGRGRARRADLPVAERARSRRFSARYPELDEVVWLQEEPENMGAWPFVHLQMHHQLRDKSVRHVARAESASPATGSGLVHDAEQADLLDSSAPMSATKSPACASSSTVRTSRPRVAPFRASSNSTRRCGRFSRRTPRRGDRRGRRELRASRGRVGARAFQGGRARRRDRHAAGGSGRSRRRLHLEDRPAHQLRSCSSNDSFQEFHDEYPWLFEPDRLIGGKPVKGVGWVFTPRIPVRGVKSSTRAVKKLAVTLPDGVKPTIGTTLTPVKSRSRAVVEEGREGRQGARSRRRRR